MGNDGLKCRLCRPRRPPKESPLTNLLLLVIITVVIAAEAAAQELPNLASTVIRGSSIYSATEWFPLYSGYLGKPISRESARAIASEVAQRYVSDGYSRPNVRIDDRMVGAGVLAIEVIETRISSVEISGDAGPYENRLRELGQNLSNDLLLRTADLQSTVRRMRGLSGLNLVSSTELDDETPGNYRLNIDTEFQAISGAVRLTNRGTDEVGPQFLLGQIVANGLLSGRANLGLTFGSATDFSEYHGFGLNGRISIKTNELAITTSGFRSRSNPAESPVDKDDRYLRDKLTIRVVKWLHNESDRQLSVSGGLRSEDLEIYRLRDDLRDERLRLVEFGMRWTERLRPTSQFAAGFELIKGINGLGGGLRADDIVNDERSSDFSMVVLDFVRVAQLSTLWSWRLNSLVQYSNVVLPYSERFKIGGDRLGRGFEVAEIAGDSGLGAKIEIARRLPAVPDISGPVSVYSFYDLAAAWKENVPGRESAASAGFGLALNGSKTNARLEVAKPLTHADVEGRDNLRVFIEFTVNW
jgi:hemolysin activation/secretion protein